MKIKSKILDPIRMEKKQNNKMNPLNQVLPSNLPKKPSDNLPINNQMFKIQKEQ